jgi:hypothetical protein
MGAKNLFQQVLDSIPDYQLAWEGMGMIAYQQGDTQGLFNALAHQLKTVGAGGDGPSDDFTSFCGGVMTDEAMNAMANAGGQSSSPLDDHTFDNNNGEDEQNQDPPPTADDEYPNYQVSLGGIFANSIDQLQPVAAKLVTNTNMIKQKIQEAADKTAAKQKAITRRLAPDAYLDDQNNQITPANYTKWYNLFHMVHQSFEKRLQWIYKQYDADWTKLLNSISAQKIEFDENTTKAYLKCTNDQERHDYYCTWTPKAKGALGMDLEGISALFTKYMQQIQDQADWYISASTPDIKRVHDVPWNDYMNQIREEDIRHGILNLYARWLVMQTFITDPMKITLAQHEEVCMTQVREIPATGPDPSTVKLKKLKTAPDYCDRSEKPDDYAIGGLSYYSDCDRTRWSLTPPSPLGWKAGIGAGPFKAEGQAGVTLTLTYEVVHSRKFKEDDYTQVGAIIGIGAKGELSAGGDGKIGPLSGSANATLTGAGNLNIGIGTRYDSNYNQVGKYSTVDGNLGMTGNATLSGGAFGQSADLYNGSFDKTKTYHQEAYVAEGGLGNFKSPFSSQ